MNPSSGARDRRLATCHALPNPIVMPQWSQVGPTCYYESCTCCNDQLSSIARPLSSVSDGLVAEAKIGCW